jgi:pyruvate dehydrogenase E2 component (dihydrolipoamide acetyltransferase)
MASEVRVPITGNAGEPAVVVKWNFQVGASVEAGEVLVSLETAKAVVEIEAPAAGTVLDIRFAEGDEAPEHEILALIGEPGEFVSATGSRPDPATGSEPAVQSPPALMPTATPTQPSLRAGRVKVSPRARRLAAERGLDVTSLTGSGPYGRVVNADVVAASLSAASTSSTTPDTATTAAAPTGTTVPVQGARRVTAQRVHASLQEAAQVTLTRYADADVLLSYASRLRAAADLHGDARIGINDLLLFATSRAVAKHPEANSWFSWEGITRFEDVNLGFAVDTGQGLLVPVIPSANALALAPLASQARALIERARSGKTTVEEMSGGTFTVSNLGGLGIHWFTPVLNLPQTCILGVGAAHRSHPDAPAQVPLSLTFDHRALDGASAATLLGSIATAIEHVDTLTA